MKHLSYIVLFLLTIFPASAISASKMLVIGGPPAVTTNDSVYGSHAGANWDTYLNKNQKTFGAWNPNTGKSAINRLVGASYTNVTKSGTTITVNDAWPGVDYSIAFTNHGWNESGTIASASGMTFQVYRATDLPNVHVSGDTIFYNTAETAFISPMIAWDANGDTLDVSQTVQSLGVQQGLPTWRVTYAIATAGVVYPVTFDPSVNLASPVNGTIYALSTTYSGARDTTSGDALLASITFGQEFSTPNYLVYHGMLAFGLDSILTGSVIDSARLDFDGVSDNSATDFFSIVYSSYHRITVNIEDYELLDGRQGAGVVYTGVPLTDSLNTSAYLSTYGNIYHFTTAGCDTIQARVNDGDSLRLVVLSTKTVGNKTPTTVDYVAYSQTNQPRLYVYYRAPHGIDAVSALDSTRIIVTYDSTGSGVAVGDTLHLTYSSAGDTVKATGYTLIGTNGLTDTVTVPYADSNYTVQARHSHTAGGYYTYLNNTGTVRTRAAATAQVMGGWSQKSIFVVPTNSINQTWTHMALICSTAAFGPKAFTTTGDTAAMADSSFNKFSVWDALADSIFSYPRFAIGAKVYMWAVWKNGDSLTTARSAVAADSLFGALTFTAGFLDSVRVTGSLSISAAPSWVTTRTSWLGASSSHADSAVSDTSTFTPGVTKLDTAVSKVRAITPNSKIALVGTVRLNPRDSLATSSADTIWTDPGYIRFTVERTSDTSWVFTMNYGSNPAGTLFDILDSTLVERDCTYIYLSPGDTLSAVPVYMTQATFPDTLKIRRRSGVLNPDSNRYQIIIHSGDSLDYNLGASWIPTTPDRYVPRYALMILPPGVPWRDERYEAQVQPVRRAA